ncbi:MAG TPA: hypothetical protein VF914_02780 [Chloroflexia bacterium]
MSRSVRYTFGVLVIFIAVALSACDTAPAGSLPTTVPTNTSAPATASVPPTAANPPTAGIPTEDFPPPPTDTTDTSNPSTPTTTLPPSPITGEVLVEGGNSMTGGASGATIELSVTFAASSTAGQVTEMRVGTGGGGCLPGEAMEDYPWEPFAPEKVYSTTAFINIQGWYANVQYRDDAGNISAVYCDDISVEGMPR